VRDGLEVDHWVDCLLEEVFSLKVTNEGELCACLNGAGSDDRERERESEKEIE
jgi:hypothetical protein